MGFVLVFSGGVCCTDSKVDFLLGVVPAGHKWVGLVCSSGLPGADLLTEMS